jgi:2-dehydro-3-deoxyphosphooctonate aldolase (KDO 8-P synthase)
MATLTLKRWDLSIGDGHPLVVIAGLNVLEDVDLAMQVGRELRKICSDLALPFVFKASFDKANRSSIQSYRGPGLEAGLGMLARVKAELDVPICTDLHEVAQAEPVAAIADLVQIPAFLCRQTDLVVATARATAAAGGLLHVKKGQFLAPRDARSIIDKIREAVPGEHTILCERGVSFGYNNLVVDMLGFPILKGFGYPVLFDVTHALQMPGGRSDSAGGRRQDVLGLARAGVSQGLAGLFLEAHPDPDKAKCDGPCALPLDKLRPFLEQLQALDRLVKSQPELDIR